MSDFRSDDYAADLDDFLDPPDEHEGLRIAQDDAADVYGEGDDELRFDPIDALERMTVDDLMRGARRRGVRSATRDDIAKSRAAVLRQLRGEPEPPPARRPWWKRWLL